jgi:hypothetical protein
MPAEAGGKAPPFPTTFERDLSMSKRPTSKKPKKQTQTDLKYLQWQQDKEAAEYLASHKKKPE